ncbi:MAG: hypothetical protein R2752_11440 [Vicinamibacterales bacterium]
MWSRRSSTTDAPFEARANATGSVNRPTMRAGSASTADSTSTSAAVAAWRPAVAASAAVSCPAIVAAMRPDGPIDGMAAAVAMPASPGAPEASGW